MLSFTKGASGYAVVTLNEKRTLSSGYYLFYFRNITTKEVVTKVFNFSEDESSYQDRYNKFPISSSLFSSATAGEWTYNIYESGTSTTDPDGLTEVESGIMKLSPSSEFSYEKYDEPTNFKVYAGQ